MFSNFNLLRGRCMLLPFPSAFTSLCAPGNQQSTVAGAKPFTTQNAYHIIHIHTTQEAYTQHNHTHPPPTHTHTYPHTHTHLPTHTYTHSTQPYPLTPTHTHSPPPTHPTPPHTTHPHHPHTTHPPLHHPPSHPNPLTRIGNRKLHTHCVVWVEYKLVEWGLLVGRRECAGGCGRRGRFHTLSPLEGLKLYHTYNKTLAVAGVCVCDRHCVHCGVCQHQATKMRDGMKSSIGCLPECNFSSFGLVGSCQCSQSDQ